MEVVRLTTLTGVCYAPTWMNTWATLSLTPFNPSISSPATRSTISSPRVDLETTMLVGGATGLSQICIFQNFDYMVVKQHDQPAQYVIYS